MVCTGDFNSAEGKNDPNNEPIDFVFVTNGIQVDTYKIIDEKISGMYLSDHAGICVDLYI